LVKSLNNLREKIAHLETGYRPQGSIAPVRLGHAFADTVLNGGLKCGALHEVFADERNAPAGTAFALALALRLAAKKILLWVQQDFSATICGQLSPSGLRELGLNPERLILVRAFDVASALRAASDALSCNALGAIVLEPWGEAKIFNLVASRRFTLAAAHSGVSMIMLRVASKPRPSTAETRWLVESEPSYVEDWGNPVFSVALVRNRHGRTGCFSMEWSCDERIFREPAHSRIMVSEASGRPAKTLHTEKRYKRAG